MQRVVRAFPVKSKEAVLEFARAIDAWPREKKQAFFNNFGAVVETWHFQMIGDQPYVIGVADGEDLEEGFVRYASMEDEFTRWFQDEVRSLSGYDLTDAPKGPVSEFLYRLEL